LHNLLKRIYSNLVSKIEVNLMKKQISKLLIATILVTSVSSCAQSDYMRQDGAIKKQAIGGLGGAVVGGVLGSKIGGGSGNSVAIGLGTLLGAMAGSSIGQSLDAADLGYYNTSSQRALENASTGQQVAWNNPDSGNYGTVTPTNTYRANNGQYCREYQQTITVDGRTERAYGTACRSDNGSWRITQ
jgi:surface antigen